jgi:hypothetical protein
MTKVHFPQTEERANGDADRLRDMAAKLVAELFDKQFVAEREWKRRRLRDHGDLTAEPTKVYYQSNEQKTNHNR